ncbi:MAG: tol-pal system protein YbgF [Rhodocyclaceae bacterium]|jgi:tol-pal system protein YbgF|nr:tol-pal system protein YbgF [Accumulibacter sp.]HNJ76222.1 tol-pal system protein YbgF [Azospira sp.]HNN08137.1 tol-pal system protein YbgF [Azospira sp.]HNN46331.1 tol-pal system protein YbgF [Azospira sp.]
MRVRRLALALAALGTLASSQAWALFDDDEARRQIKELRTQTGERLDTQSRAQLDLANQIESLKGEVARLRGQVESLTYELETAKKRQQDFYVDLDERLRKIEPASSPAAAPAAAGAAGKPAGDAAEVRKPADPAEEAKAYEAALNQFKAGKYKESAAAFAAFVKNHPDSDLAPSAQYWQGNSHYGLRDCKKAIEAQKVVVARWGDHPKAPDAMLNMSTCQQELGDAKGAKQTLEMLVAKYPGSSAAASASQRLKKK